MEEADATIIIIENNTKSKFIKNELGCPNCLWTNGIFYTKAEWDRSLLIHGNATIEKMQERQFYSSPADFFEKNTERTCPECKIELDISNL